MNNKQNFFVKKNFLIYGFGKSGYACFHFLRKKNNVKILDDNNKNIPTKYINFKINIKSLNKHEFNYIFVSPGIDIKKCKIANYLLKNKKKIISELDIFYLTFPQIRKITITGTNGKSTTSKLLFDIIKAHNRDVRLTGNIGNPLLSEKNIRNKTLFIIEASSYQLEYSKFYRSEYSLILNLSPDHLERHGTFRNYINAKFKLIKMQKKTDLALIENQNNFLNKCLKKNKINSKIIKVNYKNYLKYLSYIKNNYFKNTNNHKNLSFILAMSKYLNLNRKKIIKVVNNFKELKFRQQITYDSSDLMIINDSKSTSLSATRNLLESYKNIYWLVGGLAKKGDKFDLKKKYFKNIKAFIYGKDKVFFSDLLKKKIEFKISVSLKHSLNLLFKNINFNNLEKKVILFSPSAASFDQFRNFEERGRYFNKVIKKYLYKFNKKK